MTDHNRYRHNRARRIIVIFDTITTFDRIVGVLRIDGILGAYHECDLPLQACPIIYDYMKKESQRFLVKGLTYPDYLAWRCEDKNSPNYGRGFPEDIKQIWRTIPGVTPIKGYQARKGARDAREKGRSVVLIYGGGGGLLGVLKAKSIVNRYKSDPWYPYDMPSVVAERVAVVYMAYKPEHTVKVSPLYAVSLALRGELEDHAIEFELPDGFSNKDEYVPRWKVEIWSKELPQRLLKQAIPLGSPGKLSASKQTCYTYGKAYEAHYPDCVFRVVPVDQTAKGIPALYADHVVLMVIDEATGFRIGVMGLTAARNRNEPHSEYVWPKISFHGSKVELYSHRFSEQYEGKGFTLEEVSIRNIPKLIAEREAYWVYGI